MQINVAIITDLLICGNTQDNYRLGWMKRKELFWVYFTKKSVMLIIPFKMQYIAITNYLHTCFQNNNYDIVLWDAVKKYSNYWLQIIS